MKSKVSFAKLVCAFVLVAAASAHAGWSDFNTEVAGTQDASWPEPASGPVVIKIYTDAFTEPALEYFKIGVRAWTRQLPKVTVEYVEGDRPDGVKTGIQMTKVPPGSLGSPTKARASIAFPVFPDGSSHGNIFGGEIEIETDELGKPEVMQNIGVHEFGHLLGLDDNSRTSGDRINAMDPDFNDDSLYLPPSSDEITLIAKYYTIPEPATLCLLGLGGLLLRTRKKA